MIFYFYSDLAAHNSQMIFAIISLEFAILILYYLFFLINSDQKVFFQFH